MTPSTQSASQIRPEDVPDVVRGLLSVGDAIGVAKSHGALRGDTVEKLIEAGELAFEHLAPVLPGDLMEMIAEYVEECIAEHEQRCGNTRASLAGLPTVTQAARIIGVAPSTLTRRSDLRTTPRGNRDHVLSRVEVFRLANVYRRRSAADVRAGLAAIDA